MKATHVNAIRIHKGSNAQKHEGSTHECNNKCKNKKAQGAKATTRCKWGESNMHEGNTKCEGSNKVQRRESNMHEGSSKCKGNSKAQGVKATTRCKGTRATHAKVIARCEGTSRYENNSRVQRQSETLWKQKKLNNNGEKKALIKLKQKHPSTHKTQDSMRKTSKKNKKGRHVPFVKNIRVYRR